MRMHISTVFIAFFASFSCALAQNVTRLECEEQIFNGQPARSYAATITIDGTEPPHRGVRVFRGLPTHRKIVVPCNRIDARLKISVGNDGNIAVEQYRKQKK